MADAGAQAGEDQRLANLRHRLVAAGLDGFVLARTDPYLNEFLPDSEQLLAWLTGFTGSAGTAVVLPDAAALLVDGRYSVQARQEVSADWQVVDDPHTTVPAWVSAHTADGARIGADPWRYSKAGFDKLAESLEAAGARLVPVADNPVLALWDDRPPAPVAPATTHELVYTGRSAADKLASLSAEVAKANARALVLTQPTAIAWLLNVRGGDIAFTPAVLSYAILYPGGQLGWYVDAGKISASVLDQLPSNVTRRDPEAFTADLDALAGEGVRLWLDPGLTPAAIAQRLTAAGTKLYTAADPLMAAKARKTDAEIGGARSAHERDGAQLAAFFAWLKHAVAAGEDVSELSAGAALHRYRAAAPRFAGPSFPTIAAVDDHGAIVHYAANPATDRAVTRRSLLLLDSGGQYRDGTTDVTRTLAFSQQPKKIAQLYTRVLKAHIAVATARFPAGTPGSQIDALARQQLWPFGLDYDHGTGHGVGSYLAVHEGPVRIAKSGTLPLEAGIIFSNEPGYYRAGAFGIRLENLVCVRQLDRDDLPTGAEAQRGWLGFETLTLAPFERQLIEPGLLTAAERDWLDGYHARVYDVLAPLVDAPTADWLMAQTQAI